MDVRAIVDCLAAHADADRAPGQASYLHSELRHLGNTYYITKLRLSCQVKVCGPDDVKLLIPDAAKQLQKRSLLKPA